VKQALPQHNTLIEWTHIPGFKGETLNPNRAKSLITGRVGHWCQKVGDDCANCYAERANLNGRFNWATKQPFTPAGRKNVEFVFDEARLLKPLSMTSPRAIFWTDMTDFCGDWVPDSWLDKQFAVMGFTRRHIHMLLTKRPDRLAAYTTAMSGVEPDTPEAERWDDARRWLRKNITGQTLEAQRQREYIGVMMADVLWPFKNIWLGTSVGCKSGLPRLTDLAKVNAQVLVISFEPLIEDLGDITSYLKAIVEKQDSEPQRVWAILGGESGYGDSVRDCHLEWMYDLQRQCEIFHIPIFIKQIGARPKVYMPSLNGRILADYPITHPKGGDQSEWPSEMSKRREWPMGYALEKPSETPNGG